MQKCPLVLTLIKNLKNTKNRLSKKLLLTSQIMRINMAEVILKARKRMSILNDFSDVIPDKLILNFQLLSSTRFQQVMRKYLTL